MNFAFTGGIGAGKSTLMNEFAREFTNCLFFSFDKLVDELREEESWLSYVEKTYKTRDRREISKLAFADEAIRQDLMAKSSFKLGLKLGKILANGRVNFVEVPLLFEFGLESEFDQTILITADTETRIQRAMQRDGKSREHVEGVIAKQMTEEKKALLADIVIDTTPPADLWQSLHDLKSKIPVYI